MGKTIAVLPGDGIGPEVTSGAIRVLETISQKYGHNFSFVKGNIGGSAYEAEGHPLPESTLSICKKSDAILLGAVGGPKWDTLPAHLRPEKGLLAIRKELELFANLRPVVAFDALLDASPLKRERVTDVDFVIVRELTGGLYFGNPSERRGDVAVDTLVYSEYEIERIVDKAFQLAKTRKQKVTSVDKANVLESSKLWREIVEKVAKKYPDVTLEHVLVDAAAMKLITEPASFDVIVTENMFGDILSDEASVLTGSLGMLPSASLREDKLGLYEPAHGSAPDIAGQNKANPLATIMSAALLLRNSLDLHEEASVIERAVTDTLNSGYHTADLSVNGAHAKRVGTQEMVDKVIENMAKYMPSSISN
ncbi:3-isopropylmalate dehydrogenase [Terrilactibacillus laevilacticus]|uniref:3-isopropylmalate dehydrogenase n=1 Tax=Terrilactibacillus laevilacticus TaxID=1380157 RepID=A0ABW5PSE9_9BACI|nr:3-isopropylmalate dehydrogenase [Terrilactibacillus laevilacticus]